MLTKPQTILFDLGGVLMPSPEEWTTEIFPSVFPEGLPPHMDQQAFFGLSRQCLDAYFAAPLPRPAVDCRSIVREKLSVNGDAPTEVLVEEWYSAIAQWEVRPLYPFVCEVLEELAQAGLRMGLVSNTVMDGRHHRRQFEEQGILDYFGALVFSAEFGTNKPAPSIFAHALDLVGGNAETAWFVGDKPARDICGAHAAGMTAVLVNSESVGDICEAPQNMPDLWIQDISALPGLIDALPAEP